MSFLPIFDRPNSIGEINSFLRRVVLQNGNSLLTGAESRVTLKLNLSSSLNNATLMSNFRSSLNPLDDSLFRFKDRFSNLMCSNVIYKYTCSGCDATYYGKTKRHLIVRCREHLGINKAGQKIKSNSSSIGEHITKRDTPSLNSQTSSIPMVLF